MIEKTLHIVVKLNPTFPNDGYWYDQLTGFIRIVLGKYLNVAVTDIEVLLGPCDEGTR